MNGLVPASSSKVRAGVLGAGGFTGRELLRLLARHEHVSLEFVTSHRYASQSLAGVFPELGFVKPDLVFSDHPQNVWDFPDLDVVFISAPDQVALKWVETLVKSNIRVIDLGGAFRLKDANDFEAYYQMTHNSPELLKKAIYGLSEVSRSEVISADLVANPGCYPTAVLLPLWFVRNHIRRQAELMIIDSKSGVSGAGARSEKDSLAFSDISENFYAYKVGKHQHTPEIRDQLRKWYSKKISVRFTPHLLPLFRGILSTIYIPLRESIDIKKMKTDIKKNIAKEKFIRFYDDPGRVRIRNVQFTNFLDFAVHYDALSRVFIIISAIDNLGKGAAGQAVQNMNILFGLEETLSLF